jgi:NAD dependent epimerase/dehydratase family enzyme
MMKILMTGATGLIGREIGKVLVEKGHQLLVVSRDAEKARETLPFPAEVIVGDLNKGPLSDERLASVEAVINLMGEPVVGARWTQEKKDSTPKVNPQLAVELVYQELKRVEAYTKRIENAMEKGSQLEMSIEELIKTLKEESKKREEYYILKRGILLTQILLLGFLILIAIYKFWF